MKKLLLISCAFVAASVCLEAGTNDHVIRASFGTTPGMAGFAYREFVLSRPQTLYGIYGNLYVFEECSPVYSLEVGKNLTPRLQAGISVSTVNGFGYMRSPNDVNNLKKKRIHDYVAMLNARYEFFDGGDFSLYGGGGVGAGLRHTSIKTRRSNALLAEFELVPLGIKIDSRIVSFYVEGAVGSLMNGCRIGIDFNF